MKKFFGHLKTVIIHRYWVCHYCFIAGRPIQGLLHDLSKFNPVEFFESVKYWSGDRSPIDNCKDVNGYSAAWMHHKGRNKHHYEYWVDNLDKGGVALQIPYKYAAEMICDFLGAGRAYNGKKFTMQNEYNWWLKKKSNPLKMNYHTMKFVDLVFEELKNRPDEIKKILRNELKDLYKRSED